MSKHHSSSKNIYFAHTVIRIAAISFLSMLLYNIIKNTNLNNNTINIIVHSIIIIVFIGYFILLLAIKIKHFYILGSLPVFFVALFNLIQTLFIDFDIQTSLSYLTILLVATYFLSKNKISQTKKRK